MLTALLMIVAIIDIMVRNCLWPALLKLGGKTTDVALTNPPGARQKTRGVKGQSKTCWYQTRHHGFSLYYGFKIREKFAKNTARLV